MGDKTFSSWQLRHQGKSCRTGKTDALSKRAVYQRSLDVRLTDWSACEGWCLSCRPLHIHSRFLRYAHDWGPCTQHNLKVGRIPSLWWKILRTNKIHLHEKKTFYQILLFFWGSYYLNWNESLRDTALSPNFSFSFQMSNACDAFTCIDTC